MQEDHYIERFIPASMLPKTVVLLEEDTEAEKLPKQFQGSMGEGVFDNGSAKTYSG